MIRPLTLIGGVAFLVSGLYVFQTKEEVGRLERELRQVHRETEEQRARTRLLLAEWARLNDQDRLRALAQAHLRDMHPMEPQQFLRFEDALRRLPAPQAFAAATPNAFRTRGDLPSAPGEVLVFRAEAPVLAAAAPAPPRAEPPRPEPARAEPARVEPPRIEPVRAEPPRVEPARAEPPRPALRAVEPAVVVAPEAPPTVPVPAPPRARTEVASLPPIASPARSAAPRADAPPAPAVRTAAHVVPAPVAAPAGSLLGGGTALPPPVPFGR
jgi:hypothetical protein